MPVAGLFAFPKSEPGCVVAGAGTEVLGVWAALVALRNKEPPDGVDAVGFPNREAGLAAEGVASAGLDSPCCPKSERPPEPAEGAALSVVAGFEPNTDEGSTGFVVSKRDMAGF